ncbi:hypothetical protein ASD25_17040 [Brevundimonas sp. Root1423]|nr:hypothetical protein ASD25_17040 [Brevundimonas sp. Root1423]KRA28510.1 hypothetical protein ASD59_01380 [Brevundimonas sp. Root608]
MTAWRLYSEPYAATGNIGDGGFRRLLGAPSLEGLQLVLREAIQNSCDAAKLGIGPSILIRLRTLTPEQVEFLRASVFGDLPFVEESRHDLLRFLESETPRVLEICDFNTTGLGGPTRADRIPDGVDRTDFIDFLRNVGTQRNTALGGGTYGFGKASLYMASRCSTIIVDTLAVGPADPERRIMACHLGASGARSSGDGYSRKYTGRHWWGVSSGAEEPTDPATGEMAAWIAAAMGSPERGPLETGTSIIILDPDLAGETVETAGIEIVEALLWNFWPRMMENAEPAKRIVARVEVEGEEIEVPLPEVCPPLDLYARAMTMIREKHADVVPVSCQRPQKLLGHLAIVKGLRSDRLPIFQREDSLFPEPASHIALMRPAELVVTNIEGGALPDDRAEWAGVFVASAEPEVERAFALSEPAAHDTWDPSAFPKGRDKTYVAVALKRLNAAAHEVASPVMSSAGQSDNSHPLAAVSGLLGSFLDAGGHGGPSRDRGNGGGGARSARRRASRPVFERLELHHDERTALFSFEVTGTGREDQLLLEPVVAMDGGHVPLSRLEQGPCPEIVSVTGPDGDVLAPGSLIRIGQVEGSFTVRVTVPDNCAVGLQAMVGEGGRA